MLAFFRARRLPWLLGSGLCLFGLAFAYVLQYGFGLEPCPLCIFQRIAMLWAGLAFLAVGAVGPVAFGRWVGTALVLIGTFGGIGIAGRHVWLQSLPPDQVPACGPPLEQLMAVLPMQEAIAFVLRGEGSCAVIDASWLGLSLPAWTLLAFVALSLWAIAAVRPTRPLVRK